MSVTITHSEYKRLKTSRDSYLDLIDVLGQNAEAGTPFTFDVIKCMHPDCDSQAVRVKDGQNAVAKILYTGCESMKSCCKCNADKKIASAYCEWHYVLVEVDNPDRTHCLDCHRIEISGKSPSLRKSRISSY